MAKKPADLWRPIKSAPAGGTFIVAAWNSSAGSWVVGEAHRDPEKPEDFWWVNDQGTYTGEPMNYNGLDAKRWQPLPDPPTGEP